MKRRRSGKPKERAGPSKPLESAKNPMLMFGVLSHLFNVIAFDFTNFKSFRLVCREWAEASFGRWRQEVWLSLRDSPYNNDDEERSHEQNSLSLDKFLEFMNTPEDPLQCFSPNNHFRKYKVSFSTDLCFNLPGRFEFWSRMGPKMTHLNIFESKISSSEDFSRVLFEMTPNLKSFQFQSRHYEVLETPYPFHEPDSRLLRVPVWDERVRPGETNVQRKLTHISINLLGRNPFNLSWIYFFARLPNIKKLKIEGFSDIIWKWGDTNSISEPRLFFKAFQIVREQMGPEYFSQIAELNIHGMKTTPIKQIPTFLLPTLKNLNFPLRALEIDTGYSRNVQGFKQILELYQNTLERLTVHRVNHCAPYSNDFPYGVNMSHLTELHLIGPIVKNLNFLRNVQNLKRLKLSLTCSRTIMFLGVMPEVDVIGNTKFSGQALKNLVLDRLQSLTLESDTLICSAERVKALGKLFPNLKTLFIGLNGDGFSMLCKTVDKIEILGVQPNKLTIKGILGKAGQNHQEPNITDLKELKALTLGTPLQYSRNVRLTTDSLLRGLLDCQNLKHVYLVGAPKVSQLSQGRFASKYVIHYI